MATTSAEPASAPKGTPEAVASNMRAETTRAIEEEALANKPSAEAVLRQALTDIESATRWFAACGGAVSRDDMTGMLQDVRKRLETAGYA